MTMQTFTLASWNVNSLPVRAPQMLAWLEQRSMDVLAVQETKVTDDKFPHQLFTDLGYHIAYSGQKTYNGVAFISRLPLTDIWIEPADIAERRIIAATIQGIRVINLYVPNGSEPSSEKYLYKLSWLDRVTALIESELQQYPKLAVVGDFNIAPQDIDVHDPKEWTDCVLCSPQERAALTRIQALGLRDSFREMNQGLQEYSWWDYRAASFRRNRGLRIDLILLSQALHAGCLETGIDPTPRQSERPSDHAPVWATLRT